VGQERISAPYRFELTLGSRDPDLDLAAVLRSPASIEIDQGRNVGQGEIHRGLPRIVHGRLASFETCEREREGGRYRAVLVPRFWRLSLSHRSRIFLDRTIPQILEEVLQGAGFAPEEYELRLTARDRGPYPVREYVVQYEESDLDFVSRWLEHEGIFYFFEQSEGGEKVVFADSVEAYRPIRSEASLRFDPAAQKSGEWFREERVFSFTGSMGAVPRTVMLKDYNYRKPDANLLCSAEVSVEGEGIVYEYNNHYRTKEEGEALARIRAEEIRCREKVRRGKTDCRAMRAGATWDLWDHFRSDCNGKHLIVEVRHRAVQRGNEEASPSVEASYENEILCLSPELTYRPPRTTPWPAIRGVMHARIDGEGADYAEPDADGCYKVRLPLDLSDRGPGQASRAVRMATPYAGTDHGIHFPLHQGTEVLLTHIDGDPDRPIISGAVPNAATGTVVHDQNNTNAGIKTAGGNQIAMVDTKGHERILIRSGSGKSHLVVGAGSAERADLTSTFTSGWGHAMYMFGSTGWTTGLGAMKIDFTAGYPLVQAAVGMLKLGCEAGGALLGKQAKDEGWPAAAAMIVPPLVGLGGSVILTKLFSKLVKSKIQSAVVKKIKTFPEDNTPWYKIHQHVYKLVKGQWDYMMGHSTTGLGAYLIRGEGGTRLQLTRGGESILVGTEKGQLILYGGQNVWITSPEGVQMNADFFLNFSTNKGSISLTELGLALNFGKHAFLLEEEKVTLQSNKKVLVGAGTGEVGTKGPGKEAYVRIIDDGLLQEVRVSAREQIELHTSKGTVKCTEDKIELAYGDDTTITLKKGEIELKAKKVSLIAEDLLLGDAAKSDVIAAGKSIALSSKGTATIRGQGGVTVNQQQFAP